MGTSKEFLVRKSGNQDIVDVVDVVDVRGFGRTFGPSSVLLLHPRWLITAPEVVAGWEIISAPHRAEECAREMATASEEAMAMAMAMAMAAAISSIWVPSPLGNPDQPASKDGLNTPSPPPSEPSLNAWANLDDFDESPPLLSPASANKARPLVQWPGRIRQQKSLDLPQEPTPSGVTRARRGVATKSYKHAAVESGQGHEQQGKAERAERRRAAATRKEAKMMKTRKVDVSQLADRLLSSSLW